MNLVIRPQKVRKDKKTYILEFSSEYEFRQALFSIDAMISMAENEKSDELKQKLMDLKGKMADRCDDKYAHDDIVLSTRLFEDEILNFILDLFFFTGAERAFYDEIGKTKEEQQYRKAIEKYKDLQTEHSRRLTERNIVNDIVRHFEDGSLSDGIAYLYDKNIQMDEELVAINEKMIDQINELKNVSVQKQKMLKEMYHLEDLNENEGGKEDG